MISSPAKIDFDIRLFKRYPRQVPLSVTVHGRDFRARMTDFSPNGIGMIVDGSPPLKTGDGLEVLMHDFGVREKGNVAWKREIPAGLRVGVRRSGSLRGFLNEYRISDLLIGLQRTLKTGILEVRYGTVVKRVFFRRGDPVFATSSQDRDRLGDVLMKKRIITREQYDKAAEIKRETGGRYAVILVNLGFLKPSDLFSVVKVQVKRIISSLFLMREGEFEFSERPLPMEKVVPLNISLADLLYREVKKHADVDLVRDHLLSSAVDFSKTPLNLFQDVRLSKKDREIVSFVNGTMTIRQIITLSRASDTDTLKTLFALLEARILEIRTKGEAPAGLASEEVFSQSKTPPSRLIEAIDRMQAEYDRLGYYGVPGLDAFTPSSEEIKKAYYRAAKEFHPDRHFGLPEGMKTKLTEIFTVITNAYITLSYSRTREEYDNRLKKNAQPPDSSVIKEKAGSPHPEAHVRATQSAEIARSHFKRGVEKEWRGLFEDAAHLFAKAIDFDWSMPQYYFHHGRCLLKIQKLKDAVAAFRKALEMEGEDADLLAELGHAYAQLGLPLRARTCFEKALNLHSSHKRAAEGIEHLKRQKRRS